MHRLVAVVGLGLTARAETTFELVNEDKTIRDPAFPQYCLVAYDDFEIVNSVEFCTEL